MTRLVFINCINYNYPLPNILKYLSISNTQYRIIDWLEFTFEIFVSLCWIGQIAFRAKVGEKNQLSDQGMLPEELGVVLFFKLQLSFVTVEKACWNLFFRWLDTRDEAGLLILDSKIHGGLMENLSLWRVERCFSCHKSLFLPDSFTLQCIVIYLMVFQFLRGGSKSQDPVIGFVYWAAKDDFLALFSRLHLPK